jgi:hypothetical protein
LLNPYQLPAHGRRCRCAPTVTRLLSRDLTCQFSISNSFGSGALPDCRRTPSPSLGVADDSQRDWEILHVPIWMVCRASYINGGFVRANV